MVDLVVTGAGGQLGRQLVGRSRGTGLSMHAFRHAELDITNRKAVQDMFAALRPKVLVNTAAWTAVDRAEHAPQATFAVNRDGACILAEICAASGAVLLQVSTDYVFDGHKAGAYGEADPVAPLNVYGVSMAAAEEAIRARCPRHVILRSAWLYGSHGRNFVKTMLYAARLRHQLPVVCDQFGSPTYAGDLADALLTIARRAAAGRLFDEAFGTFHCCNSGWVTWHGFAETIFRLASPRLEQVPTVQPIPSAVWPASARRPANSVLDCSRLHCVHGIALRPWEEALAELLSLICHGQCAAEAASEMGRKTVSLTGLP